MSSDDGAPPWRVSPAARLDALLGGSAPMTATADLAARAFGVCALLAVASAWWQLPGLVGPAGVLPTGVSLLTLHAASGVAALGALALIAAVLPGPGALAVYGGFLVLVGFGGPFLRYQWDNLLLEGAVLFALIAPWRLHGRRPPWPGTVLLGRVVLFKLMLFAGLVKLWSGDPTWADWSALEFHFWTQPLPNPLSWWAHQLPESLLELSVGLMFLVELVLPFGLLLGRPGRVVFFLGTTGLMLGLAATGSYGTFQGLTVALAVLALDDTLLPAALRPASTEEAPHGSARSVRGALVVGLLALNVGWMGAQVLGKDALPGWWRAGLRNTWDLHLVHPYGLFAVMTTARPTLVVEVSDGEAWQEVPLVYAPTDPAVGVTWPGPHLPRLDWHLWFTALDRCGPGPTCFATCDEDPVLEGLMEGVLAGREPVLGQLGPLPVPAEAIRGVRVVRWELSMTDWEEGWQSGRTWRRERVGLQCPPLVPSSPVR